MRAEDALRHLKHFREAFVVGVGDQSPFAKRALAYVDPVIDAAQQQADLQSKVNHVPAEVKNTIHTYAYGPNGERSTGTRSSLDINRDLRVMEAAIELYYAAAVRKQDNITPAVLWRHIMGSEYKAPGMAVQALAQEIIDALLVDESTDGYDLTAGLFGTKFSDLVRRWAALEYQATGSPT